MIDVTHPVMEVIPSNIVLQGNVQFKTLGVLPIEDFSTTDKGGPCITGGFRVPSVVPNPFASKMR